MPVGRVEQVDGDLVTVSIERQDMCGECHACEVVGEIKKCTIKCHNLCKGKSGELVEIELENTLFLKATALMYGIPLIGLLVGLGVGFLMPSHMGEQTREVMMAALGLLGMGSGLMWIRKKDKHKKYDKLLPKAVKVVSK
ncbi:MAG: SoxR reducing system RseC family protein [Cellulosilyticaceae bacterium]